MISSAQSSVDHLLSDLLKLQLSRPQKTCSIVEPWWQEENLFSWIGFQSITLHWSYLNEYPVTRPWVTSESKRRTWTWHWPLLITLSLISHCTRSCPCLWTDLTTSWFSTFSKPNIGTRIRNISCSLCKILLQISHCRKYSLSKLPSKITPKNTVLFNTHDKPNVDVVTLSIYRARQHRAWPPGQAVRGGELRA